MSTHNSSSNSSHNSSNISHASSNLSSNTYVYKNVYIIGTSHISEDSVKIITEKFFELKPDIVCVELDSRRLYALENNIKPDYSIKGIKYYGVTGYLFAVIAGFAQKKLGNIVGIKPGSDMMTAVKLSKDHLKELKLIDQDIQVTMQNLSREFTFREKMRIFWDVLSAPFRKKQQLKFDLKKVPSAHIINELMKQLKDRYPNLYKVLIDDRNKVMAKNIYKIMTHNSSKSVLVVIGAGHGDELLALIKKEEYKRDRVY